MDKLIKAVVVATATTIGAAIILHQLDKRAQARSDEDGDSGSSAVEATEIDADQIDPAQRKAMLAELEAQL